MVKHTQIGISKRVIAHVMTMKYISTSKETLKLLLNIRVILSPSKIQLLQKQQFVNYFAKILNIGQGSRIFISLFYVLSQKIWEICTLL